MKNVHVLCLILFLSIFESCVKNKDLIDNGDPLTNELVKSNNFRDYMIFKNKVKVGIITDKYNMSNLDMNYVKTHDKNLKSHKALIEVYTNAGMDYASDFINNSLQASMSLMKLKKEIPDLNKMSSKELNVLCTNVYINYLHGIKIDYVGLAKKRAINEKRRMDIVNKL